ncbi:MAG: carboxypeptidase regulatory-like domain-containing protein [Gemmatimonadales bacterium]
MIAFQIIAAAILTALQPQVDSTARIRGQATSSFDGRPIAGVMISAPEAHKFVVTDSKGTFWLDSLPAGPQKIRVSYRDRETEEFVFQLESGRPKRIVVLIDVDAEDLDPVVVEVQHPSRWRDLAGFYARMNTYRGFGHFFTREHIQRTRPRHISSMLAREGIMQICVQGCLPTRFFQGVACVVPVSVDGLAFRELDYDLIPVGSVAGVEVYPGTPPIGLSDMTDSNTPNSVWQAGPYNSAGSCGSVMIWTR